ncbi:MAG: alpha-glucan family phosphorylase [Desulfosarcina sp.]|nr:alpha-glucan family phosphorylase [Desulfosarcina sp.]
MKFIQTFQVFPDIPEPLAFLETLSRNLWWSWNQNALELFRRINPRLWEASGRNPIVFATRVPQDRFNELAHDDSYLAHLEQVRKRFENRVLNQTSSESPWDQEETVAYFSMEFGIHETLPLFAGGLGILAGDHLKAASGLKMPLVGVGLLYREGYFRQYLDKDGWQQETYPETDLYHLPLSKRKDKDGNDLVISLTGIGGDIHAQVWKIRIGRIPLILLDTNLPENTLEIRDITARLYSGEQYTRLAQEVLLGIGGMRALDALGIQPTVCHMNEGHCAFVGLERLRQLMDRYGISLEAAREIVSRTTVFTTHTPVAAGHDEFPPAMVKPYLKPFEARFDMSADQLVALGQPDGAAVESPFSMFILGLRTAQYLNGVSKLHGQVARHMWSHIWPTRSDDETPITHVTNGVHIPSVLAPEIKLMFERYLGPQWNMGSTIPENARRIDEIFDEELWQAHEMCRSRLIRTVRELMYRQYGRRNAPLDVMKAVESVLDQDTLTIAFARRFATYKRAHLLFQDPDRLEAIINSSKQPVQFIFAGKAHPKDNEGKGIIRSLVDFGRRTGLRHRFVFLEDYDLDIARCLVQGADVWLNTPRRPMEACGTSGMKAALNGVLNVSILDGWWCEGYSPERGWRIGNGEEYQDHNYQDEVESQAVYNLIENEVAPRYYDRTVGGTPKAWLKMMKASMKMAMSQFCSLRMVSEYEERFYLPASRRFEELVSDGGAEAHRLSEQHRRYLDKWGQIHVSPPLRSAQGPFRVNQSFEVTTLVQTGELRPDELNVELYYGKMRHLDRIDNPRVKTMRVKEEREAGNYLYGCQLPCSDSGRYGFTVRVTPNADAWIRFRPELLTWA